MDEIDDSEPQHRLRTSSFRSTNSGFVHCANGQRSPSVTSEEPSGSGILFPPSPIKYRDDSELAQWRDIVSSLPADKETDFYSKPVKAGSGNLRRVANGASALGGRLALAGAPAKSGPCIPISTFSSLDLLFDHLRNDTTEQMAAFLKEKATLMEEEDGERAATIPRGVKRPAAVIDADSPSDVEGDLEEDAA